LIEPPVEAADQFGELVGFLAAELGRVGRRSAASDLLDAPRDVIEPRMHRGELVAVVIVIERRRLHAFFLGLLNDDGVEPFAQRHA